MKIKHLIQNKMLYYVMVAVLVLLSVVAAVVFKDANCLDDDNDNGNRVIFNGEYSTDGIIWKPFNKNTHFINSNSDSIKFRGSFNKSLPANSTIWMQLHMVNATIECEGNSVFIENRIDEKRKIPFVSEWHSYTSSGINSDETVSISIDGEDAVSKGIRIINNIYTGNKIELLRTQINNHLVQIIAGIIMLCIGLALIIAVFSMKCVSNVIRIYKNFIPCGLLLVSGGICTLIDYSYINLIFTNNRIINLTDYLSQSFICIFLMVYIYTFLKTDVLKIISTVMTALMLLSVIVHFVFRIEMKMYLIIQIPIFVIGIVMMTVFLIKEYRKYDDKDMKSLFVLGGILSAFIIAELLHFYLTGEYWIYVFQFGLIIFSGIQFTFMIKHMSETFKQAQEAQKIKSELMESKLKITLSQIQPHFIYNNLTAIKSLCRINPQEAEKTITEFSNYLRINMDSLTQNECVFFKKELEHITTYINLEKIRFGDDIKFIFDIQEKEFTLPSISIQPIVENAVKYGIRCTEGGMGTVKISTYSDEDSYIVEVTDDGVGFDVNRRIDDSDRSHIGILNVRSRLESMCGGTLTITSEKDKGTKAIIKIPK